MSEASLAHNLGLARAKHRRAVDKAIVELRQALEAIGNGDERSWPDFAKTFIGYAIADLEKSKPEPGAWEE